MLLFAHPWQIPPKWLEDQYRLAQMPNSKATLASLRANIGLAGQPEVLVDQLPRLRIATLIVWGIKNRVFPYSQGEEAVTRMQEGSLELIPNCDYLPHMEQPGAFAAIVGRFLAERISGEEAAGSGVAGPEGGKCHEKETDRRDCAANSRERTGDDDGTT